MIQITQLTSDAKQQFNMTIAGYDVASVYLEYKPQQYGWFMNLAWSSFALNNERVSTSPNLLRPWKDVLPFGILIADVSGAAALDPIFIDSWVKTHQFWMLEQADLADIEGLYAR